jgi:hypothetical protein
MKNRRKIGGYTIENKEKNRTGRIVYQSYALKTLFQKFDIVVITFVGELKKIFNV